MNRTDTLSEELTVLFDEMLAYGKEFRRKTYAGVMEYARERYAHTVDAVIECFADTPEEERGALTERLAQIIPEHAYEKMQSVKKRNRDRMYVDYNMNMAVYVVPLLNESKDKNCVALTERMVELWNEKGITNMRLMHSTYDEIAGGFERKLCYITTAVCLSQGKADDCYELELLREYRDTYLLSTPEGEALVKGYYNIAPTIVSRIARSEAPKQVYEEIWKNYLAPCVGLIEAGRPEACQEQYMAMVYELKGRYMA